MTKLHEEVLRGTLRDVALLVASRDVLGEIVVVLDGAPVALVVDDETVRAALREQLAGGVSVRDAVASVADALGTSHREAYRLALALRADDAS